MEFFATIRGIEIVVTAERWIDDPSVGISLQPEIVYAKTLDGQDFPLTDTEEYILTDKAINHYYDRMAESYDH